MERGKQKVEEPIEEPELGGAFYDPINVDDEGGSKRPPGGSSTGQPGSYVQSLLDLD